MTADRERELIQRILQLEEHAHSMEVARDLANGHVEVVRMLLDQMTAHRNKWREWALAAGGYTGDMEDMPTQKIVWEK